MYCIIILRLSVITLHLRKVSSLKCFLRYFQVISVIHICINLLFLVPVTTLYNFDMFYPDIDQLLIFILLAFILCHKCYFKTSALLFPELILKFVEWIFHHNL
ncbi:hypothetical protein ACJX0J_025739 [Zea mays]